MKTINLEADRLYRKWKLLELNAKDAKAELMKFMATLPEGHTSSLCSYTKKSTLFDTSIASLMAISERITVPMKIIPAKEVQDWKAFEKLLKGRVDWIDLQQNYALYKEKADYIRSEKVA